MVSCGRVASPREAHGPKNSEATADTGAGVRICPGNRTVELQLRERLAEAVGVAIHLGPATFNQDANEIFGSARWMISASLDSSPT